MARRKLRLVSLLAALLFVAVGLSGCAGKPKGAAGGNAAVSPTASFGDETGAVEGTILNEEQLAVADAEIGLTKDGTATTRADALGKFTFSDLAPGRYVLQVQKLEYRTEVRNIDVTAGQVTRADFTLVAQQPEGVSYKVPLEPVPGRFACAVGFELPTGGRGWANCKVIGGLAEEQWATATGGGDKNFLDFEDVLTAHQRNEKDVLRSVVIETQWTPASPAAKTLLVAAEKYQDRAIAANGSDPATYGSAFGGSGVKLVLTPGVAGPYAVAATKEALAIGEPAMTLAVVPHAAGEPLVLPLQQEFKVWITLFYNEAAPDDYTALPT